MPQEFTNDFSKQIWKDNYKYGDEKNWSDNSWRVATAVASVEKTKKLREYYAKQFYEIIYTKKFLPGGRILSNAGVTDRKNATLFNCYVYHPSDYNPHDIDSLDNIFESLKQSAKILGREGGLGINLSYLRPEGMYINGIGNRTPGPLKFAELWLKISEVITAGTQKLIGEKEFGEKNKIRKGAMMLVMDDWNETVLEFIEAKQKSNKFSKFNFSVSVSDELMAAVENNDMWYFKFPDIKYEKYESEWDGNLKKWIDKGYPIIETGHIKAKKLWDMIMISTYNRNDPGVLFMDNANRLSPISYCNHLKATNPCVVGDTLIYTNHGWLQIKNLNDYKSKYKDLRIITRDKKGNYKESELEWSGVTEKNAEIFEVTFSNYQKIRCNYKHRLYDKQYNEVCIGKMYDEGKYKKNKLICGMDKKYFKILNIEKLNHTEDVYDLTANPNYNFWSVWGHDEFFWEKKPNGIKDYNFGSNKLLYNNSVLNVDCAEIFTTSVCNLGSINLPKFLFIEGTQVKMDQDDYINTIKLAVRFLDNVNDIGNPAIDDYNKPIKDFRNIGLGITGLGSFLMMLNIEYGSDESLDLIEYFMSTKHFIELMTSAKLGKEKGSFKKFDKKQYFNTHWWKNLVLPYKEDIEKIGYMRNGNHSTIAPTGNTSIIADIVSGGIEPVFMKEYRRWVIVNGHEIGSLKRKGYTIPDVTKDEWFETEFLKFVVKGDEEILKGKIEDVEYEIDKNRGLVKGVDVEDYAYTFLKNNNMLDTTSPEALHTAMELSMDKHLKVLEVCAKYCNQSISKTINIPKDYPYDDFKNVYINAYKQGIKGVTTYREGTMTAVLEKIEIEEYQNELDEILTTDKVIKRNIKLPTEYFSRGYNIKDKDGKKWYINLAFADSHYKKPFAIFINTNNRELTEVAEEIVSAMEALCLTKGIEEDIINDQREKYKSQSNVVKIARSIGMALRHNIKIVDVLNVLNQYDTEFSSLIYHIKRLLAKYVPDGTKSQGKCEACGSKMIYQEGCSFCGTCGNSKCG